MADPQDEQRAGERRQIERQYEIDVITAQYADEVRAGRAPRIEDYAQRFPQYAAELLDFAVYYHTIGIHTEALDGEPDAEPYSVTERALALIRERRGGAGYAALRGIKARGQEIGYQPPQLAEAVGLTAPVLDKLEARSIAAATIPPALIQRLAKALQLAPDAVAALLRAPGAPAAGPTHPAGQPSVPRQESFLDAVQSSALPPERKQEWAEIVRAEVGDRA